MPDGRRKLAKPPRRFIRAGNETAIDDADAALAETAEAQKSEPPNQQALAAWIDANECPAAVLDEVAERVAAVEGAKPDAMRVTGWASGGLTVCFDGAEGHRPAAHLLEIATQDDRLNPLAPLVRAWNERPIPIKPETRADSRILPVVHSRPGRELPALGGLVHGRTIADVQLPMLPNRPGAHVPILDAVDVMDGLPIMAHGRGAPLALRLFVYLALCMSVEDRKRTAGGRRGILPITVRTLRNMHFPNGWHKGRDFGPNC